MIDQNKVILMSKMALYEKKFMRQDQRITDYYIEDYIYINNFVTRVGISLITGLFVIIGALKILYKEIIFPMSIEQFIDVYLKAYIGPWIISLIIYTIISSLVYRAKYKKADERMQYYKRLKKKLEAYED